MQRYPVMSNPASWFVVSATGKEPLECATKDQQTPYIRWGWLHPCRLLEIQGHEWGAMAFSMSAVPDGG